MKAQFLGHFVLIRPDGFGDGEWELDQDHVFYSEKLNKLIVAKKGFRTNLASVPRIPIAYFLFGGLSERPAATHDWLYTNNVEGITREEAWSSRSELRSDEPFKPLSVRLRRAARSPAWRCP